jgi:WD40 repeat protein
MYWDASTGELIRELESPAALMSLAMHPRCEVFASGDASGDVRVWSYDRGDCCALGQRHTGEVLRCAFSPCGSVLVSVDSHGAIMLWDTAALAHDSL